MWGLARSRGVGDIEASNSSRDAQAANTQDIASVQFRGTLGTSNIKKEGCKVSPEGMRVEPQPAGKLWQAASECFTGCRASTDGQRLGHQRARFGKRLQEQTGLQLL